MGAEGIVDDQNHRGLGFRLRQVEIQGRVQVQLAQWVGVDGLAVDMRSGSVRQLEKTVLDGEPFDGVLMMAQVVEKIVLIVAQWLAGGGQGRKPVDQVDHAVHVGADDMDRTAMKIPFRERRLDVGGPFFFVLLLADDSQQRGGQVDNDGFLAMAMLGIDLLAQAIDQMKESVVALKRLATGLEIGVGVAGFPEGTAQNDAQAPQGLLPIAFRGFRLLADMLFQLTPFDSDMAGIVGHPAINFSGFPHQKGHMRENVVDFAEPPGDDETHLIRADAVTGAAALEGNDRRAVIAAEGILFGEDNAVALLDAFGQTVDDVFKPFELDHPGIVHAAIDFRAEVAQALFQGSAHFTAGAIEPADGHGVGQRLEFANGMTGLLGLCERSHRITSCITADKKTPNFFL
ncbi:hypothetical protein DESC_810110 [Desulfosarcina cetonica]|nr:hypothetical protein DESC_810110 [Desulfosarcina cetonica]